MKKEITFTAKQVGERVKERRTELNLTMPELGKRVGVNKSTIQRYVPPYPLHIKCGCHIPYLRKVLSAIREWSGAIMERVYRKEMELPIENMKQFLDGILHIYDEGRTAVKMGDLFGIVTAAEERVAEKEKFRGTLTSENAD